MRASIAIPSTADEITEDYRPTLTVFSPYAIGFFWRSCAVTSIW